MTNDDIDDDELDGEQEDTEPSESGSRRPSQASGELYNAAMTAYVEYPGQHAKVAAVVSAMSKRPMSAAVVRAWWTRGVARLGLPAIAEALKNHTKAALGQPEGSTEATLNPVTPENRIRLRRVSVTAMTRARTVKAQAEVERERLSLERDKVRAELARAEADKARAEADLAKAKAAANASAGLVPEGMTSLVKMKAEQSKLAGGIRAQALMATGVLNHLLMACGRLVPRVEEAIEEEMETMTAKDSTALLRRAVSTLKDFSEFAQRTVLIDNLVHGEATEITRVQVETTDPVETIIASIHALQAAHMRGAVELTPEQRALVEAVEVETAEIDEEVAEE